MKTNNKRFSKGDGDPALGMPRKAFAFKQKSRRLGGKGLSLEAFASAKTKPLITPSQIRERREFYQNAKKVQKYKKLVKHMSEQSSGHNFDVPQSDARVEQTDVNRPIRNHSSFSPDDHVKDIRPTQHASTMLGSRRKQLPNFKKSKEMSSLEKLRYEYEKESIEKENARKEEQAAFIARKEAQERARQIRKNAQQKMRKKTSRGQPVMKHRMEHLLEKIQRT